MVSQGRAFCHWQKLFLSGMYQTQTARGPKLRNKNILGGYRDEAMGKELIPEQQDLGLDPQRTGQGLAGCCVSTVLTLGKEMGSLGAHCTDTHTCANAHTHHNPLTYTNLKPINKSLCNEEPLSPRIMTGAASVECSASDDENISHYSFTYGSHRLLVFADRYIAYIKHI